jgi:hypothetical protein
MAFPSGSRFLDSLLQETQGDSVLAVTFLSNSQKLSISIPRAPRWCCRAPPVSALTNSNAAKGEPNELTKPYPVRIVRVLGFDQAIGYDRRLERQVGGR